MASKEENADSLTRFYADKGKKYSAINNDSALRAFSKALYYAAYCRNPDLKGKTYYKFADYLFKRDELQSALPYYKKAMACFNRSGNAFRIGGVSLNMGVIYGYLFDFASASHYYAIALRNYETLKDTAFIVLSKVNLIDLYMKLNEESKAKKNCEELETIYFKRLDPASKALVMLAKAEILQRENKEEAAQYAQRSLDYFEKDDHTTLENRDFVLTGYKLLIEIYGDLYNSTKNKLYKKLSLEFNEKSYSFIRRHIDVFNLATRYYYFSNLNYYRDNYDSCIYFSKAGLRQANKIAAYNRNYIELLYMSYEKKHLMDSAFAYLKRLSAINNDLKTDEIEKKLLDKEIEYKLTKNNFETKAKLLRKDQQLAKNRLIIILVISITVISFLAFLLYILRNQKKRNKQFSIQLIESQEHQLARLAREIHDGIGQSLLVLKMQNRGLDTSGIENIIEETRAISRGMHPVRFEMMSLQDMITNLLEDSKMSRSIYFTYDIEDVTLSDLVTKINIYRIIQEAVSNIYKHSNADQARVTLTANKKVMRVVIRDNGVGINTNLLKNKSTLGLLSIRERANLIGAEIDIKPGDPGTIITLVLKT